MSKPCFVYIIAKDCGTHGTGPVKIGISDDPEKRVRGLQTASPYKLVLMCKVYAHDRAMARAIESMMHADFADRRTSGEWFDITPFHAMESLLGCYRELLEAVGFSREEFFEYAHSGSGIAEILATYLEVKALMEARGEGA